MRINFARDSTFFHIDIDLSNGTSTIAPAEHYGYSDLGMFAEAAADPTNMEKHNQMLTLQAMLDSEIGANKAMGADFALLKVPIANSRYVATLNRVEPGNKFYQIYDTRRGCHVRKHTNKHQDDEAFCISPDAEWLCRVEDEDIEFKAVSFPDHQSILEQLKMTYKSGTLDSYGDKCDKKQTFKDRIYRDLHVFHMYEEEKDEAIVHKMSNGVTKKLNMQLMCMKYDRAVEDPFKLKANREFLFMMKILLNRAFCDELKEMPLCGVLGTKRIEMYDDELTFFNDHSEVEMVQMSSEPKRNFALV